MTEAPSPLQYQARVEGHPGSGTRCLLRETVEGTGCVSRGIGDQDVGQELWEQALHRVPITWGTYPGWLWCPQQRTAVAPGRVWQGSRDPLLQLDTKTTPEAQHTLGSPAGA